MTSSTKKILAVILCVGFIFRVLFLGKRQLWTEELIQALVVRSSSLAEMMGRLREGAPLPAPIDFFVQKLFVLFLGDSTWALRLHAVVLATLSLWLFFRVGRRLFGDRVALYSTALLTFYPLHYHYSQEGRPIALVVLLTLISVDLLLGRLEGRLGGVRGWLLLTLTLALILYSSLLGILVLFAQLGCLIACSAFKSKSGGHETTFKESAPELPPVCWNDVAAYASSTVAACVLFIPWVRFLRGSAALPDASPAVSLRLVVNIFREIGDNSPFVVVLLLAAVVCGIRALLRHGRQQSLVLLLSWSGILIIGILIVDIRSAAWAAHRYMILAVLPLVLVAGYGLSYLGERMVILDSLPYRASSPSIAYVVILVAASAWIAQSHWRSEPVDWRGTAKFLQQQARQDDEIAMPETYPLLEYYAPTLAEFRRNDLDPGEGLLAGGEVKRRFVVCLDGFHPDPCAALRTAASKDRAWGRIESQRGFTIYVREK